jgi:hypothetical protein
MLDFDFAIMSLTAILNSPPVSTHSQTRGTPLCFTEGTHCREPCERIPPQRDR